MKIRNKVMYLFFICWLPLAVFLSILNVRSAVHAYGSFHGKTDIERVGLITQDMFSTLKMCRELTPKNTSIFIAALPYEENVRLEYYLYPRRICWSDGSLIPNMRAYCQARHIEYYISYDAMRHPVITKVE